MSSSRDLDIVRAEHCAECATALDGPFCSNCGLRAARGEFTLRRICHELITDALDLNRGVLFTFASLLRHPGATVHAYLAGRTGRYTNPIKYLLIAVATAAIAWWLTDWVSGGTAPTSSPRPPDATRVGGYGYQLGRLSNTYGRAAWVLLLLLTAGYTRLVFRRFRHSFAEHLLFATFTFAQMILLAGLAMSASRAWPSDPFDEFDLAAGISVLWYVCAATAFFDGGVLRTSARAVLVVLLSVATYFGIGALLISLFLWMGLLH